MDLTPPFSRMQIRALRPPKPPRDPNHHQGILIETEPDGFGGLVPTATYFLTGSECRFSCSMCDLWQYTFDGTTPRGTLPQQVRSLHAQLAPSNSAVGWLKLYNAANFFDAVNVPAGDLDALADLCRPFDRIVVENHAAMFQSPNIRERTLEFAAQLPGKLEVAMGLETIDPDAMRWLNKSLSLAQFEDACVFLRANGIRTRAFVLLQPPGTQSDLAVEWCIASCRAAYAWGVRSCSVIPTRASPGLLESLRSQRMWSPPTARQLECVVDVLMSDLTSAIHSRSHTNLEPKTLLADLWEWEKILGTCDACHTQRRDRLYHINRSQRPAPPWHCSQCSQET